MNRSPTPIALVLATALIASACSRQEAVFSDVIAFEGARLIVGDGSVIEEGTLVLNGSRIVAAGSSREVAVPDGVLTVDLSGKTVIPALIDVHAHLGYEGYESWGAANYSRDNVIEHLERYAYYGFAAVFSAGSDPDDLALDLQRDQVTGTVGGARFLFAAGMAPPGQGPNNQFLGHALTVAEETGMTVLRGAATPAEGREAVRDVASKGISFIKIWVDDRGGTQQKLQPEVYRAIADEARVRGIEVVVHQQTAEDMSDLLGAGVSGFLHGRLGQALDRKLAEQIKEAGVFLVPNLGLSELRGERVSDDPFLRESTNSDVLRRLEGDFNRRSPNPSGSDQELARSTSLSRLSDVGVAIVLGTDAGAIPDHFFGYTGHRELEIFVRLGMTPMQAIMAGTSRAAESLGLDDLGVLRSGKSADFVVLDRNPLQDIRNTRTISHVYLAGREINREELRGRWN